jgi:hypothetical protein
MNKVNFDGELNLTNFGKITAAGQFVSSNHIMIGSSLGNIAIFLNNSNKTILWNEEGHK